MGVKFKIYSVIYFVTCIITLFFIDVDNSITEMMLKIFSLIILSVFYINVSKEINFWYILILMCAIAADSFFIYDPDFLEEGIVAAIIKRLLYFLLLRQTLKLIKLKSIFIYLLPGILIFGSIAFLMLPYLKQMSFVLLIICFLNISIISVAYFKFLKNNTTKNLFFLSGVFIIGAVDFLLTYNKFLDYNLNYVLFYTFMYNISRYLICLSLIENKYFNRLFLNKHLRT